MADLFLTKHNLLHDGGLRDTVNIGKELFWRNSCQVEEVNTALGAQFNGIDLGEMTIVYLTFGSEISIDPVANHQHLIVQTTLTGNSCTRNGKQSVYTSPNDIAVINPSLPTRITFQPGCAHLALKIDRSLIRNTLSELLRQQVNNDLEFDLLSAQGEVSQRAWLETIRYLCKFYDKPEHLLIRNQHLLKSHFDITACCLLTALRHNYSAQLQDDHLTAAPRHVRRACEYIEHNIKEPISMIDLCQVTDVTERTLQNGFKNHLGQTPSAFIRSRRLHHIHEALQRADENTNVSRIMWEHGVNNPGLWANHYRQRYGCYPSETLSSSINYPPFTTRKSSSFLN